MPETQVSKIIFFRIPRRQKYIKYRETDRGKI